MDWKPEGRGGGVQWPYPASSQGEDRAVSVPGTPTETSPPEATQSTGCSAPSSLVGWPFLTRGSHVGVTLDIGTRLLFTSATRPWTAEPPSSSLRLWNPRL